MYRYDYEIVYLIMHIYANLRKIIMIKEAGKAVAGMRRSLKLIESGRALKAFVAGNTEPGLIRTILDACERAKVPVELVKTKSELGKACGIDVDASVAVLPKN
jgi:large subunit ribosomal protein L7A